MASGVEVELSVSKNHVGTAALGRPAEQSSAKESSNFPPNILKIKKTLLPHNPLRRPHRSLRKPSPRLRIMAEINPVMRRIQNHLMHSHNLAFAKRRNLQFLPTRSANGVFHRNRRPRRRILLMHMMPFENLSRVPVLGRGRRRARDIQQQVDADREICAEEKANATRIH